jgi:hypothetical protein
LTALDAEKADGIVMRPVDARAYFLQELNSRVANFNPFILYGITNIEARPHITGTAGIYTINVALIVADYGNDLNIVKKMMRYSRALKETIEENFYLKQNSVSLEVQSLIPDQFQKLNSSENYRVVGVDILATLS